MAIPSNAVRVLWDFGDGQTSTEFNPRHVYNAPAVYTVCLTVWLDTGEELNTCKTAYVSAVEWAYNGLNVAKTNICYRYGIEKRDGIGPSELSGDNWIRPNGRVNPIILTDENNVSRLVVLDQDERTFYEITTPRGAESLGHLPVWKDKTDVSGMGGYDYEGGFTAKGATGQLERYFLEMVSTNMYTRPFPIEIRNNDPQTNYDEAGYPVDLTVEIEVRTEDQSKYPAVSASKIKLPKHEVVFDKRVEGHYITTSMKWNSAPFLIVGLSQNFIAKDRMAGPTGQQMTEGVMQEHIADVSGWYTRGPSVIKDRVSGVKLPWTYGVEYQSSMGPDGIQDSALFILGTTELVLPPTDFITFWYEAGNPIGSMPTNFKVVDVKDNWVLAYIDYSSSSATFKHGQFFDIRYFRTPLTEDELLYMYNDVKLYNGEVNLPDWL